MWPTGPLGQTHVDPHQMRMAHRRPSISSFGNSLEGFISLRRCVEPEQLSDLAFVSHNFADTTVVDGCVVLRGTSRSNRVLSCFIQWCTVYCYMSLLTLRVPLYNHQGCHSSYSAQLLTTSMPRLPLRLWEGQGFSHRLPSKVGWLPPSPCLRPW